ncbi:hypothetical protein K4A83_14170 [Spirulina subsalsa FACHB-351]|uniref:Glutamine synthetase inactivating factor IF7 n=1 Tax=Spirulina subsalsa FACHB-351 TaxID=234711 RepID=A0ABT3L7D1_9CYAN|nr:hypothetical protein [Spirulina subsalsa]MCW6037409.1 hypothetical protein [Spirulina subsalsa FACHB-351]
MDTQKQARALMMRHNRIVRNRQESMLGRAASEIGVDVDTAHYSSRIQGKTSSASRTSYDRSNAAMS